MQKPQPLGGEHSAEKGDPGDVAARPVEASDVALLDRVTTIGKHNGNCRACDLGGQNRIATSGRSNHYRFAINQIGRERRQSIRLVFCKTVFDRYVSGFEVTVFTQAAAERVSQVGPVRLAQAGQVPDERHRLLGSPRDRPRRSRAAEQGDELAARNHSITSSACPSKAGGTVRSSALADLRL